MVSDIIGACAAVLQNDAIKKTSDRQALKTNLIEMIFS
jgi:hypothetical protein